MKYFYAIEYPAGFACDANTGNRYGTYFRFESREERDEWIDNGPDSIYDHGAREIILAADPEFRATRRKSEIYSDRCNDTAWIPTDRGEWLT